jgi:hypothetical protein
MEIVEAFTDMRQVVDFRQGVRLSVTTSEEFPCRASIFVSRSLVLPHLMTISRAFSCVYYLPLPVTDMALQSSLLPVKFLLE